MVNLYHGGQNISSINIFGIDRQRIPFYISKSKSISQNVRQEKGFDANDDGFIKFDIPADKLLRAIGKGWIKESEDISIGPGANELRVVQSQGIDLLNKYRIRDMVIKWKTI